MSSPQISGLLGPVVALNAWTFAMEVWMYAVRIPFLEKHRIAADNTITKSQLDAKTPTSVRWKVDNFNHLFEQPTQFYAISLVLAFARHGKNEKLDVYLGWAPEATAPELGIVDHLKRQIVFAAFSFRHSIWFVVEGLATHQMEPTPQVLWLA
ncbi:uncharacterized protein ATNIH1004_010900 [Aspergillus tanneri]|uniref:Uncharacterized protein n=1 Tax=Aspergillus tanneri TaxID=1220188 RepID=A0A5M9M5H5_9EURO|nr:uncharacterized protein ATNIH1004_010900 [Aspergillus tanneri]KAA8641961.1 hypothetical protein ATNIH1004_010900 [Aspergillus tanneri]